MTFIVTMDGRLTEQQEHNLLQNENAVRITASSYLITEIQTATEAIDMIAPTDMDKKRMKPWYVLQVSAPWTAQGAEQDYQRTHEKTIQFLRAYPEDMSDHDTWTLRHFGQDKT